MRSRESRKWSRDFLQPQSLSCSISRSCSNRSICNELTNQFSYCHKQTQTSATTPRPQTTEPNTNVIKAIHPMQNRILQLSEFGWIGQGSQKLSQILESVAKREKWHFRYVKFHSPVYGRSSSSVVMIQICTKSCTSTNLGNWPLCLIPGHGGSFWLPMRKKENLYGVLKKSTTCSTSSISPRAQQNKM